MIITISPEEGDDGDVCRYRDFFIRKQDDGKIQLGLLYFWVVRECKAEDGSRRSFVCDPEGRARYELNENERLLPLGDKSVADSPTIAAALADSAVTQECSEDIFIWLEMPSPPTPWTCERHRDVSFIQMDNDVIVATHVYDTAMTYLDMIFFNAPI